MHSLSRGLSILALVTSGKLRGAHSFVPPSLVTTLKSESSTTPPQLTTLQGYLTPKTQTLPKIIQGGMGVRISSWKLAREVSKMGELGVISGTAMVSYYLFLLATCCIISQHQTYYSPFKLQDVIFVRTLQDGKYLASI